MSFPSEIQEGIARGVAAYVRATESAELPGRLRRFKGFTERGVRSQAEALVQALSDKGLRARIVEWLDDKPKRIPARDEQMLRIACERPEGWKARLAGMAQATEKPARRDKGLETEIEREREKVRKARLEARAAKDSANAKLESERARASALAEELKVAKARLAAVEQELATAHKKAEVAEERLDREVRKARRDAEKVVAERDVLKERERATRKELAALQREVQRQRAKPASARSRATSASDSKAPARRKRLPAPLGRLSDDPETLAEWLDTEGVRLIVDGYNVTKADGGYGELSLEAQRERLVDSVSRVVRGKRVTQGIVVFDGSAADAPVVSGRRSRGKVKVEYSAPGVIADDHIVALVKSLPTYPVVVVTNDRELQDRVARHAATVARSDQLIALFR